MYYSISYKQWNAVLKNFLQEKQAKPLLVLGTSGIGKSATIKRAAEQLGDVKKVEAGIEQILNTTPKGEVIQTLINYAEQHIGDLPLDVADIRLADIPKEDLAGFPKVNEDKHQVDYLMLDFIADLFVRPNTLELASVTEKLNNALDAKKPSVSRIRHILSRYVGRILLFFDEINRMDPDMMQVIMELIDSRTMHQKPLKDEVRIIAAMNPMESAVYTTTNFTDVAFIRRWQRVLLNVEYDDWKSYMGANLQPVLDRFLTKYPDYFIREEEEQSPLNPAIWEEVNTILATLNNPGLLELKLGSRLGDSSIVRLLLKSTIAEQYERMSPQDIINIITNPTELETMAGTLTADWLSDMIKDEGAAPAPAIVIWLVAGTPSSTTAKKNKVLDYIDNNSSDINNVLSDLYTELASVGKDSKLYRLLIKAAPNLKNVLLVPKSIRNSAPGTVDLSGDIDVDDLV